ncbi:MAG: capsular biosynthesis protein CpsI, partial [Phormidesmis sp.]
KKPQTKVTPAEAEAQGRETTAPYKIYNIGNHSPVTLMDFIATIEQALGKTARKNMMPMQPGDVPATYADVQSLMNDVGFKPKTPLSVGIQKFVDWYREYYKL